MRYKIDIHDKKSAIVMINYRLRRNFEKGWVASICGSLSISRYQIMGPITSNMIVLTKIMNPTKKKITLASTTKLLYDYFYSV